jgi:hypothetical protein
MDGPDRWVSRGSLVATAFIALVCVAAVVWEDGTGRPPSQLLLILGTAAITQLGNIIAALYPTRRNGNGPSDGGNGAPSSPVQRGGAGG